MAHKHSVYDTDTHFQIDGVTRVVKNASATKTMLVQHDHNSERFTFELPRHIDGHDMSKSNVVQVHYINIDSNDNAKQYSGVYEVDDLQISPDGDDVVICSWLISGNATRYVGNLSFVVRFACVSDDGTVEYAWNTAMHSKVFITEGIYNGDIKPDEPQVVPVGANYYVTPERYGAKGDGTSDDTAAIQAAIDSGLPVTIPAAAYRISSPLTVSKDNTIVQSYGEIIYSGTEYAVILDSCANCDIYLKKITATNGSGLKLHSNASKMCAYNNLEVGEITAKGTAILTHAESGNQYNEIRFTKLNADICIDIQCSATGWNTETKWYGGHMGGVSYSKHATYAIKAVNSNGGNVTTHRFYNVGFEGVVDGCILENVKYFVFNYPRTSESIDDKAFILKAGVTGCIFRLSHFMLRWLDFNDHAPGKDGFNGAGNIFSGIFYTNGGSVYTFSYFEIWYGKMYNCNQKTHGYRNVLEDNNFLTLDPSAYHISFAQELLVGATSCVVDTRYYHSGNINTLYAVMNGDANSSTEITDSEGKVIARVADYPWKKIKLTAVEQALSSLAPNGWVVEVLD